MRCSPSGAEKGTRGPRWGGKRPTAVAEPLAWGSTRSRGDQNRQVSEERFLGHPGESKAGSPARTRPRALPAELHASHCWAPCMAVLAPGVLYPPPDASPSCCWPWLGGGQLWEAWLGRRGCWRAGATGTGQAGGGTFPFCGAAPSWGAACEVGVLSRSVSCLRRTPLQTGDTSSCLGAGSAISCSPILLHPRHPPAPAIREAPAAFLAPSHHSVLPDMPPSLPAGESELLALSAKGRLMTCDLCSPEDTDVELTPAEAGRRIKELLSGIGNTSER